MKPIVKYLLTIFIFIVSVYTAKSTHLMGGEITAQQLHDSTYLITLTTYRDTLGIPMDSIANFEVKDTSGAVIMTFSIKYDTSISGGTLALYPYGVEVYIFKDSIVLPGSGIFHISFTDCCRNGAIQNLSAPLNDNMYLTTTLTVFDSTSNSTPFFLVQPVVFLPRNTSWAYNPLPFDADGDSLVWSLDTPLTAFITPCAGYVAPSSTTSGPFSLNAVTGSISWTASTIGNYNATVLVEEYRNNVKIGEIRRDMQFIVVNTSGSLARMSNMHEVPLDKLGNYHVSLKSDAKYIFSFFAEDPDSSDKVDMYAYGEPFLLPQGKRAAFFVVKTGKTFGNEIEGTFIWKPNTEAIRTKPYIVVYRVTDGKNVIDYSVLYSVEDSKANPSKVNDLENKDYNVEIYPNPASELINIGISLVKRSRVQYKIYNLNGQIQFNSSVRDFQAGNNLITQQLNLESGLYFLELIIENEVIYRNRIVFK